VSKHTPGPWRALFSSYAAPEIVGNERRVAMALYEGGSEDREVQHNAHLIAAVPTMYDYIMSRADAGDVDALRILEAIAAAEDTP